MVSMLYEWGCFSNNPILPWVIPPNPSPLENKCFTWNCFCGINHYLGMAGRRPHRFPHNNFSSVYRIFTKLGHMIPLWKGKNTIYFGVITIIPFDNLYRRAYFVMQTFLVYIDKLCWNFTLTAWIHSKINQHQERVCIDTAYCIHMLWIKYV